MTDIHWDIQKSHELKQKRGMSFEEILQATLVGTYEHPTRGHQNLLLFMHQDYIWAVPYVKQRNVIFLKTLFPSRKYTRMWKRGELK